MYNVVPCLDTLLSSMCSSYAQCAIYLYNVALFRELLYELEMRSVADPEC